MVRRDYAAWWGGISGWVGMPCVGGVESVREMGHMSIFALPPKADKTNAIDVKSCNESIEQIYTQH